MNQAFQNVIRGAVFFTGFVPSFSTIGYQLRKPFFAHIGKFTGQRWLVTGASAGIGREIARQAALRGAEVFAVARSSDRLAVLANEVDAAAGQVHPVATDLSLLSAVDALATHAGLGLRDDRPLDVLLNNVGLMLNEAQVTSEGRDLALSTNLLGHYALTEAALARGLIGEKTVVLNMSSGGMYNVPLSIRSLIPKPDRRYDGTLAYAFQKRAQVVLNRYWQTSASHPFKSYVLHPGWVATPGVETAMPDFNRVFGPILRPVEAGADTALWLADKRPDAPAGGLWFDRRRRPEHLLPGTRGGDSTEALIEFLEQNTGRGALRPETPSALAS